jgi:hypothetical protein
MTRNMDERKQGTIESYEPYFEPLKQFGVLLSVWDQVLEEMFHQPFGTLALPFQELVFELEVGKKGLADYPRPDGISDHDFVRGVLEQAVAAFDAKGADNARLMSDDSWVYNEALGVYTTPKEKGLN